MKSVLSIQACIAQLLQPVIHHSFETIRVWYAVSVSGARQFLVESDDDACSQEHCTRLQRSGVRLLTLVGPAGMGKTG